MYKYLVTFFKFILPILGKSALAAAADELTRMAYPNRPVAPRPRNYYDPRTQKYNTYGRVRDARSTFNPPFNKPLTMADFDDEPLRRQAARREKRLNELGKKPFHDVLMLAMDITGPNSALVYEFIEKLGPETNVISDANVTVDTWWIADDDYEGAGDGYDSAVFVHRGNQEAARKLLRENGLVD